MKGGAKRVLHVIGAMDRGGVETWLMHVLRRLDRRRVEMDFLVHTDRRGAFDDEIEARNSTILRCRHSCRSPFYGRDLLRILGQSVRLYDVVHSHVHYFSGYVLRLARLAGVPIRIAHSHSDTSSVDCEADLTRRCYMRLSRAWIWRHATNMIGASRMAGSSLFGPGWKTDRRSRVIHCGIDLSPFQPAVNRNEVRRELGLRASDCVLGHVGRFDTPKNHAFLLEIASRAMRANPGVRLLLIGDGPLRQSVVNRIASLGIANHVILTGVRGDVQRLLTAMDVFVFPSLYEGLPLTLLEAQAACLPSVISDVISPEADMNPALIRRLPLAAGPSAWSEAVLESSRGSTSTRADALASLMNSDFNIVRSAEELYDLYAAP